MTSGAKSRRTLRQTGLRLQAIGGRLSLSAGETLKYYHTNVANDLMPLRYWTTACPSCPIKSHCTPAKHRITRWEQCAYSRSRAAAARREPRRPCAQWRETVEHPFATIKARMGAMHFLMKTLPRVSGEMALHVLAYNLTRPINIVGGRLLIGAIRA
jgi:Transposase DDE domain